MRKAGRTEGPLAPLFYSVVLGLSGTASAQSVDMSALEACSRLESEAARLECFEAIVSKGDVASARESEPAKDPAPSAAASAPQASAAPVSAVPAAAPAALGVERQPAETVAPAATAAAPPTSEPEKPASGSMTVDDFGREHLAARSAAAPGVLQTRVLEVTKGNHDALVFHLDNGQVWRQIQPRHYPYPRNRAFDATITTGMLGEYELQVEGNGRKVSVRRLQ